MSGVSAMHAVKLAAMAMKLGEIDCAIAGGATSISRNSLVASAVSQNSLNSRIMKIEDSPSALNYKDFNPAAMDCDRVAAEYGVDRTEQDEWAYRSHIHYGNAWKAGKFEEEILPLPVCRENSQNVILNIDEQYKPNITVGELAKFKHWHGIKTITAANGAAMSDGASAILLMNREKALETGLQPLATVIANVSLAINLTRMPEAPGFAIQMVCKKAGFTLDNMDIIEINEDFACVPLIALRIVAGDNEKKFQKLKDKTNINGSSIAIGHPVTASGARIIMNLMYELRRRGGGYALGTLCGGLAQADACIIKVD
jgi:acetyl-CoA C-acetyltransferase